MSFYSKLDKAASDLLKADDFDLNKKFSIKSATTDGPTITSSFSSKVVAKDLNFSDEQEDRTETVGNLKLEYKNKTVGELSAEVDTVQLINLTWKTPEAVKGLKFEVKGKHDRSWEKKQDGTTKEWTKENVMDCFVSAEAQYTPFNYLAATGLLKVSNSKKKDTKFAYLVGGTALVKYGAIAVGGELEHDLKAPKKLDGGLSYAGPNWTAAVKTAKVFKEVGLSIHSAVLPKTSVALNGKVAIGDGKKSFTAGVSQEINDASSIRGLVSVEGSSKASVSFLYSSLLNKYSKLSLSTVVDVKKFAGGNHKYGIKLEIGDL